MTRPPRQRRASGWTPPASSPFQSSALWSRLVRVLVMIGCVGVVALWWVNTPALTTITPGQTLTSMGELTGMLAGLLICVQILLIARVPWLERAIGQDHLVGWHRVLGTSVVLLTLTHVLFIIVGGALTDAATLWSELWSTTLPQRDVLIAVVGTVVIFLAGITSAPSARKHLSYEVWFWIHTLTYVGIFLTFAHQINAGAHFVAHPFNQVLWTVLYLATASAVTTWRVILPLAAIVRHRVRVERIVNESPGVASVWLRGAHLDELNTRAGQFFAFRFLARGHLWTSHPYSVSFVPHEDRMRITVGSLGDHSSGVTHLKPGTFVVMDGPFGRFTSDRAKSRKVLLVAGGVGIGPIRALAHELSDQGRDVVVIHRAPTRADLSLSQELSRHRGIVFVPLLGRRADLGYDPLSSKSLAYLVPDVRQREVFVCGSPGMAETVTSALQTIGIDRRHIHQEELSMS